MTVPAGEDPIRVGSNVFGEENRFSRDRTTGSRYDLDTIRVPTEPEGLPIVRTSVAHGTAFDRAWQGTAEATGMVAAILTAARLAVR